MSRIANFIYARSRLIIALVALLNIVALASLYRFQIDTDFLGFFTEGNPKAAEYDRLNEKYQTGEFLSVLVESEEPLTDEEHLLQVFYIQQEIKGLEGVSRVQSYIPDEVTDHGRIYEVNETFIANHPDILEDFIGQGYYLTDQFLSDDYIRGVMAVTLEPGDDAGGTVKAIQAIINREQVLSLSLAGNEIIKSTMWDYLLRIIFILPPCAILLVMLVFSSIIRNRKFTVLSMIPAGLAALWTIGTIFWSGEQLNLVTVITPIFIIVMGAADGLHYSSHFIDNMSRYSDRRQLTVETLRMVGMPIFLTSITTMAGFASLMWTEVVPMRQMGLFATIGIGYAGLLSLFFLPAVLCRVSLPGKIQPSRESRLSVIMLAASRHRRGVIIGFLAVAVIATVYIPRLEVVSNQLMFFKESSEIRQTFDKVEKGFGGAMPLTAEIAADRGLDTLRDPDFAERILDMEREMERLPGVKSAVSLFDLVAGLNKMITGQNEYPENRRFIQQLVLQMDEADLQMWASDDGLRLMIKTEDLESLDIPRLEEFVAGQPDMRIITGMPVLFDEMNRLVVESQIRSLGLALVVIFIMLLVTIRRLRAALVGMLPIVITITAIFCLLSISGFQLNVMTANISAIAVGVGVDYAIHLISGIYYFRREGQGNEESVDSALLSLSRPIMANALGLAIGLSILFFSPLRIHAQVATVMWVAMLVSSLAALLLIPIFYSRNKSTV